MKIKHKEILLLFVGSILVFFVNLDAIFINIMEARNFITAREMLVDGNWIFTTMNDMPRYQKPPLPTWLTAFSGAIFGLDSLFGLRLPAAIMGTTGVLITYAISIKITSEKKFAFLAGLIALTSFYIIFSSRDGQWDIFTHAFMLVSIYFIIKLFTENEKHYLSAVFIGFFLGFSFLSKGPVSFYALLLPFLIAYGITFKFKKNRALPLIVSILVAAIVSGSWSFYVYVFDTKSVSDIAELEAGRWIDYNVRPFYYYWSFVVQSGLWTIPAFVALLYPYLKDKVFNKKGYQFSILWTLIAVLLLSLIPEKKSRYLMPVLFPLAINTAFYIEYLFRNFKSLKMKETWPVYLHLGIIALIGVAFPVLGVLYFSERLEGNLTNFILASLSLFGLGVFIALNLYQKKIKRSVYGTVGFIISIIVFALPLAKEINPNENYRSAKVINEHEKNLMLPVYELLNFTPELIWEYGKPIPILYDGNNYRIPSEESFLLLISNHDQQLENASKVFKHYKIEKIDSLDLNPVSKKKDRLKRKLYLVEKR